MSEPALLLEARDVAKRFDSVIALKAASLQVRPGEVHGLMGSNGAGKSTLVKIITGVFRANGGQISVKGVARSFRSPARSARRGHRLRLPGPGARAGSDRRPKHAPRRRLHRRSAQMAGGARRHEARFQPTGSRPALSDFALDRSRPARSPRSRPCCCSTRSRLRCRRICPSGFMRWCGAGARGAMQSSSSPTAWRKSRRCATGRRCCATALRSA